MSWRPITISSTHPRTTRAKSGGRNVSLINFHWMIAEKNKPVQHVTDDVHELTMHSHQGFMEAMSKAGIRGRLTMRRKGEALCRGQAPARNAKWALIPG